MATVALITAKTAAETSADFTVVNTAPTTVAVIYNEAGGTGVTRVQIFIDRKDSAGNYLVAFILTGDTLAETISGAGTYRARKGATDKLIGVDLST